ncbi:flagellar basal body P-ring protein FlgI [Thalassoglobus polymorphus]|uniref:Flagellar P-ring protein n=1 Tax=Thalassoglobus polymorphus TaxID=2527994 RepID=A0A517QPR0_9PLAN|nr:flagellar basal body P-ring protein FlgI [Thalassoglobus polymorphus]QDT33584.1 Flagellar P-ring protein precursor [Thalassoglobus polymorphus]
MFRRSFIFNLFLVTGLMGTSKLAADVRIGDLTNVAGVRKNQLVGMGLVTGLNGTGGKSPVTRRFAMNMLQRFGVRSDPDLRARIENDTAQKTDNISVVTVTANLDSFSKEGTAIDVLVSTFDDAESLQGGQLILTPLFGADGQVYAVASGPISIGGFSFSGESARVQKNHPTTGRIPNGATVELETCSELGTDGRVQFLLNSPSYETARRTANAINQVYPQSAFATDAATIDVIIPFSLQSTVSDFVATLSNLTVTPDVPAKVVINERTGTVVIGEHVQLSRVLITHANLVVSTVETPLVAQPAPFSQGETVVVPRTEVMVEEEDNPVSIIEPTTTVGELAQALNALGVAPRDLSSIFQQLKESGALHAELEMK